ncbi:hypothetical protein JKP88DRAFT_161953 [Tribonema minus]|uniref:Uncharacterized protein n=1 Tax=Tribonema minus TaxID=303371 RepID=A0A835Z4I9_9STRA|nr:hypothetical protein JKP88DRAFT_161953 [Tribonema minus]
MPVADRLRDADQKYAVVSIVAPEGTAQKSKDMMIRIYGCRPTIQQANEYARKLRDSNNFFDVYTIETHEWAPLPPRIDSIEDVQCTDERIQSIRDSYIEHLKGQKAELIERLENEEKEIAIKEAQRRALKKERKKYYDKKSRPLVPIAQIPENVRLPRDKAKKPAEVVANDEAEDIFSSDDEAESAQEPKA